MCKLVTEDMIPAIIGDVLRLLNHEMETVRKRAVFAMHRLYQMDKKSIMDHVDKVRRILCDKDPSVMGATLPLFQAMIQDSPLQFKDLVSSFVSILKQITEHRLPRDYDYHRIPSPWIQMNILRILSLLGRGDQTASEGMYEVLVDAMKRADTGINVGYAIVYECVKTITSIYPNTVLLDAAATSISRFIRSDSHNLKYIGIKGLAAIVKDHPRYATDHQMAVIDCLEDPDETLKRKTLDLLFRMTNAVNVEFIVDKLLSFLKTAVDDHYRTDLVGQITQCAERFAPSNAWFVQTIITVFELAGDKVNSSVAQTLTQLIAEGSDEDDEDGNGDDELRLEAVEHFLDLIRKPKISAILAQTMAWVLGEYGYLSTSHSKDVIMDYLCDLAKLSVENSETKAHVITALSKLVAQHGSCPVRVQQMIKTYSQSRSLDLQQRCLEFQALLKSSDFMADVLPIDASCEDIEVDDKLSFLNDFVNRARQNGAREYTPPKEYIDEDDETTGKRASLLKVTPYQTPSLPAPVPSAALSAVSSSSSSGGVGNSPAHPTPLGPAISNTQAPALSIATAQGNQLINSSRAVQQVWGKKVEPPPLPPVPAPVASPSASSSDTSNSSRLTPTMVSMPEPISPPVPTVITPTAPAAPKVLTEKEKMAAALFGGVGASKPAAKPAIRRTSQNAPVQPYSAPEFLATTNPQPVPSVPSATAAPSTSSSVKASSSTEELLELSMLSTGMTPTALPAAPLIPTASVAAAVGNKIDFSDMLLSTESSGTGPIIDLLQPTSSYSASPPPTSGGPPPLPSFPPKAQTITDVFSGLDLSPSSGLMSSFMPESQQNLQPLVINTQEFGRWWGTTNSDAKQSVPCNHFQTFSVDKLRQVLQSSGRYHHVESIPATLEAIFAATATSVGAVVLIHTKLNAMKKSCDVTVKSVSKEICSKEVGILSQIIASDGN